VGCGSGAGLRVKSGAEILGWKIQHGRQKGKLPNPASASFSCSCFSSRLLGLALPQGYIIHLVYTKRITNYLLI
jgi:hypothetical protein